MYVKCRNKTRWKVSKGFQKPQMTKKGRFHYTDHTCEDKKFQKALPKKIKTRQLIKFQVTLTMSRSA